MSKRKAKQDLPSSVHDPCSRSWQGKLHAVVKLLSDRCPRLYERLLSGATQEDMVESVLGEFQRYQLQLQLLETKLELKLAEKTKQQSPAPRLLMNSSLAPRRTATSLTSHFGSEGDDNSDNQSSADSTDCALIAADFSNFVARIVAPSDPRAHTRRGLSTPLQYRDTFMNSSAPFVVLSPKLRMLDCNEAFARFMGILDLCPSQPDQQRLAWSDTQPAFADLFKLDKPHCFNPTLFAISRAIGDGSFCKDGFLVHDSARKSFYLMDLSFWTTYMYDNGDDEHTRAVVRRPEFICILLRGYHAIAFDPRICAHVHDPEPQTVLHTAAPLAHMYHTDPEVN